MPKHHCVVLRPIFRSSQQDLLAKCHLLHIREIQRELASSVQSRYSLALSDLPSLSSVVSLKKKEISDGPMSLSLAFDTWFLPVEMPNRSLDDTPGPNITARASSEGPAPVMYYLPERGRFKRTSKARASLTRRTRVGVTHLVRETLPSFVVVRCFHSKWRFDTVTSVWSRI
jgi:hypothetical protein